MPNRVSAKYKARIAWDELVALHDGDVFIHNKPHVAALLNSAVGRFLIDQAQNLCWTLARFFPGRKRAKGASISAAGPGPKTANDGLPRIVLDITNTSRRRLNTGIQRVCRRLAEEGERAGLFTPAELVGGDLFTVDAPDRRHRIDLAADDIYVILDMFWDPIDEYLAFAERARARGVLIATCFYDVVPSIHPEICPAEFGPIFTRHLKAIHALSDIAFSISRATLDDLDIVLSRDGGEDGRKPSFVFHLGADYRSEASPAPDVVSGWPAAATANPMFLSVGTVEPKKGYTVSLDAFERLWREGQAVNFMIVGKDGWYAKALRARILGHPQFGRRLFWLRDASDAVLADAYRACRGFIQASVAEGFGIPIIEAAKHGVPVIASDIDVFKEVGGDNLIYFETEDSESLARRIVEVMRDRPAASQWSFLSWEDSLRDLHAGLTDAADAVRAARRVPAGEPRGLA